MVKRGRVVSIIDASVTFFLVAVGIYSLFGIYDSLLFSSKGHGVMELEAKNEDLEAYISGAVENPGVYALDKEDRIIDLVDRAGGFAGNADMEYVHRSLNLSTEVHNEDHIYIPIKGVNREESESSNMSAGGDVLSFINEATADELKDIDGIGASTAEKIIGNRPYNKISDLLDVKGIGQETIEGIVSQFL